MAEGFLPPIVLALRANATQLVAEMGKVTAAVRGTAAETEAAASRTTRAVEGSAATTATAAGRMSAGLKAMAGVGKFAALAAVAVGVESVRMASKFQSSMSLLVTAGGESEKNLGAISDGVLSMARATGTSTEQLAEGMYTVEKALNATGATVADKLTVLKAAAEGAKAENVDMATSVTALTSVMMSYHEHASRAVAVQNQMIAASGLAKTTMSEFASSLSTVLPVASAAGVSFDQVGGAIATLTQHGTSAQEATQELSNTIRNLQAPNQVAQKAMQQLGIGVNDLSQGLSTRGLTGTIQLVTDAIKNHMGRAGLVVVDTFNKSASATADLNKMIKGMTPDLAKLSQGLLDGSVSYDAYRKAAKGLGGQSEAMAFQFMALQKSSQGFNTMLKSGSVDERTAAAALRDVMGGATGLNTALMLGGENMGYFKNATEEVANAGRKAGKDISTWARTQKNFSVQMSQLKEQIQTAAIWIGEHLLPPIQKVFGFLASHSWVLYTIGGLIGGFLVVAIGAYTIAMAHAAIATIAATWPILAIIAAVAAVALGIAWLATHWSQAWDWIKSTVSAGWDWIRDHFYLIMAIPIVGWILALATHWRDVWNAITGAISWAWSSVIQPVARFINKYAIQPIAGAIRGLGSTWQDVWNWIVGAVRDAYNFIAGIVEKIIGAVKKAIDWLKNMGQQAANANNAVQKQGGPGALGLQGLGFMGWVPSHDKGGWIEGQPGQPIHMIGHGREYMLSREMLAGRQPIEPAVVAAVMQQAPAAAGDGTSGRPAEAATGPQVTVIAQTNASPYRIASDVGWVLRAMA